MNFTKIKKSASDAATNLSGNVKEKLSNIDVEALKKKASDSSEKLNEATASITKDYASIGIKGLFKNKSFLAISALSVMVIFVLFLTLSGGDNKTSVISNDEGVIENKYSAIINDPGWVKLLQHVDENIIAHRIIINYLNLLVNKDDLNQLIRSGELDKDKSKFISENLDDFLKYLYFIIGTHQLSKIEPGPTDAKYVYITGVIKDPRAMAATTGPEYEMEKTLLRGTPLYSLWETWREDGYLKDIVIEQIDMMYDYLQKG